MIIHILLSGIIPHLVDYYLKEGEFKSFEPAGGVAPGFSSFSPGLIFWIFCFIFLKISHFISKGATKATVYVPNVDHLSHLIEVVSDLVCSSEKPIDDFSFLPPSGDENREKEKEESDGKGKEKEEEGEGEVLRLSPTDFKRLVKSVSRSRRGILTLFSQISLKKKFFSTAISDGVGIPQIEKIMFVEMENFHFLILIFISLGSTGSQTPKRRHHFLLQFCMIAWPRRLLGD